MSKQGRRARRAAAASRGASEAAQAPAASGANAPPATPPEPAGFASPSRASLGLIALFLLYQIAMPLRYYARGGGDDERFSWRMFSSVRLRKCQAHVHEVVAGKSRAVELGKAVQIAWIGMLERGRPQVVDKLLRRRCQQPGVSETRFERSCTNTDGSAAPPLAWRMDCATFATSKGAP